MSPVFRVYTSSDMLGIETGAALKNVIALAAGMADGLGYGDNTKAALITRGIAEISRLGTAWGAHLETFYGLSGIGGSDCYLRQCSQQEQEGRMADRPGQDDGAGHGRGSHGGGRSLLRRAGMKLAERYHVEVPIIQSVNEILFEGKSAAEAVSQLMQRVKKDELNKW